MKEFIVWDNKRRQFMGDGEVIISNYNDPTHNYYNDSRWTFHQYVCLKDINNNKIYANCSIVEFDFLGFGELTPDSYKAFVKWNKERFRYDIQTLSRVDKNSNLYVFDLGKCIDRISNIKIIDTIQENKLGLIKE